MSHKESWQLLHTGGCCLDFRYSHQKHLLEAVSSSLARISQTKRTHARATFHASLETRFQNIVRLCLQKVWSCRTRPKHYITRTAESSLPTLNESGSPPISFEVISSYRNIRPKRSFRLGIDPSDSPATIDELGSTVYRRMVLSCALGWCVYVCTI